MATLRSIVVACTLMSICCILIGCVTTQNKPTPKLNLTEMQEFQMDLIRKGKPPLPTPLTIEMDSKLVEEGVLPPLDQETNPQMKRIRPRMTP